MLIVTTDTIPGKAVEALGLVKGIAQFREIEGHFSNKMDTMKTVYAQAQELALQNMWEQAEQMGADGVVAVRVTAPSKTDSYSFFTAYGTAVKFV